MAVGVPSPVHRTVLGENAANAVVLLVEDSVYFEGADKKAASIHAEEWPGSTSTVSPTAANGRYPRLPSINV